MEENKTAENNKVERTPSKFTTVKSFNTAVKRLIELKLVNKEDGIALSAMVQKVTKQFMGGELGI